MTQQSNLRESVILSAVRTPMGRFRGAISPLSATQLGAAVVKEAVRRASIADPAEIDARVAEHTGLRCEDVADALLFMLSRPPNATVRDLVLLPQNQDI